MIAYHFVGDTLRDGRPIPADGVWLEESGDLVICRKGLHASKHVADALQFAPGNTLCLVEIEGDIQSQADKVCARRRKIIARFDATELLRADARASALSVIHLWKAPEGVIQYLKTGDESLRAAAAADADAYAAAAADADADAAADAYAAAAADAYAAAAAYAAYAAADAAADAAAYAAAYAAAKLKHRVRLAQAVNAKFRAMRVKI